MAIGAIFLLIVIVLVVLIVIWAIRIYNRLVNEREFVNNAMAQIAAQVESRWDALTNLISATKEYSSYEGETLENVVEARSGVSRESSPSDIEQDDQLFEQALREINVVVEQYPDLKASNVYQQTMTSLNEYENNVRQARMIFNDTVTKYNRLTKFFPQSIIANLAGFGPEEYFESSEEKREMPEW